MAKPIELSQLREGKDAIPCPNCGKHAWLRGCVYGSIEQGGWSGEFYCENCNNQWTARDFFSTHNMDVRVE